MQLSMTRDNVIEPETRNPKPVAGR